MYWSLVKKDFEIAFCENIGIIVVQMLFILIIISVNMGVMGYGVMATAFGWQLLMGVSVKEKKNNSLALLITMPYEKGKIITTRYISAMFGVVGATVIYEGLAFITNMININVLKMLTPEILLTTVCAYALFIGITLPLYFKFDDTVVRGVSLFLIMGVNIVGFLLWDHTNIISIISEMSFITNNYKVILILVTIVSLVISRKITLILFEKMEF
ncbi:MAG: ABC-2 transporter permease [Lachnotalea sp.]